MITLLNEKNQKMSFKNVFDSDFSKYGKVLDSSKFIDAVAYIDSLDIPEQGNLYIAHDNLFSNQVKNKASIDDVFGYMPLQYGYVNGKNSMLNALEYHKSSEINIAVTDMVLMLGKVGDIIDNTYDVEQLEMFYIPANTVIEIYSTSLHFSPCKVADSGFKCGVILPYGTNMEFVHSTLYSNKEDKLLFKNNKWLLTHPENEVLVKKGAVAGLVGPNFEVKY